MFDIIKRKIYNVFGIYKEKQENKKALNQHDWVTCNICGFKGSLEEFLTVDSTDTKCPNCKEDSQVFNL